MFRFRKDERGKLTKLLPCKLADLKAPPSDSQGPLPAHVRTVADVMVQATEEAINSHLTIIPLISESQINPANVRAAIRRLRIALKPFVDGWVDDATDNVVPSDLDAKLAARDHELSQMRLPSARQRALAQLCQRIEVWVRQWASANGEIVGEQDMLRYIDAALTFAKISHPGVDKHRARLAALVFPP
jgi:hypothetical protein